MFPPPRGTTRRLEASARITSNFFTLITSFLRHWRLVRDVFEERGDRMAVPETLDMSRATVSA